MQSNFLGWLKKFGPGQNNLRPVKGQGISFGFGVFRKQRTETKFLGNN